MRRLSKGILLAGLSIAIIASAFAIAPARADTVPITLFGSAGGGWGYTATSIASPGPRITVTQGDVLALTLHSQDGVTHNWFVDYNNNNVVDPGEPSSADFTGSTAGSYTFTANRTGTFTYKCKYHPTVMVGTIVVQTPPTFALYGSATKGWGLTNTSSAIKSPGPRLTVNQGDVVTIDLTSADGVTHNWFIDYNNDSAPSSGEPSSPDFGSVRFIFTASQAGNYTYRCRFHPTVMFGTITIKAVSGTPTTPSSNTVLIIGGVIIAVAIVAVVAAIMTRRRKPPTP